ncbi:Hypothetical_protein [Hexamita inflata]|uniref:Hypothetical_protein n=1 Tax=Hexamita inflata TaxID=28002 RepID=A0ABP1IKQ0_9EUKA
MNNFLQEIGQIYNQLETQFGVISYNYINMILMSLSIQEQVRCDMSAAQATQLTQTLISKYSSQVKMSSFQKLNFGYPVNEQILQNVANQHNLNIDTADVFKQAGQREIDTKLFMQMMK